ncbi:MAG: hypothetical protein VB102_02300, partial [Paludibacter sp.]|nr:hypothetical protein [Paludibacter sp.]
MKRITLLSILFFQFLIIGLHSQTLEWNTLGSGDKTDLYSEQNYMDVSTGLVPVENTINGDTEINRDVCIRSGVVGGENGASLTLKTGIGGLTVENATLIMNSAENAGIDLGVGNTNFIMSNATVRTQFVHNATIIMEGRSQ